MLGLGKKEKKLRGNAGVEHRETVLGKPASEAAPQLDDTAGVWVAVMETFKPEGRISVVSFKDGTTSLYYSNGKGFEGLDSVEQVKDASRAFVEICEERLSLLDPTTEHPYPKSGNVRFYCRKGDETFTTEALEDVIAAGGHPLTPVYKQGMNVFKQVQLALSR